MASLSLLSDLDSLFLIAGLVSLCLGFAVEWIHTRETPHGRYARIPLTISIMCGLLVVGSVLGRVSAATIATYTLIGLQIIALILLLPVIRRSLSDGRIHSIFCK
jgi:quinol-cytochrome oxidoreductase complex cytochrome b subunit